jgi:hypothetical protein
MKAKATPEAPENATVEVLSAPWIEPDSITVTPHLQIINAEDLMTFTRPLDPKLNLKEVEEGLRGPFSSYDVYASGAAGSFATTSEKRMIKSLEANGFSQDDYNIASAVAVVHVVKGQTIGGSEVYLGTFHSQDEVQAAIAVAAGPVIALRAAGIIPDRIAEQDQAPSI